MLKIRGLLEENYQPATANRMPSALRGVLKECWHAQLVPYASGLRRAEAVALERVSVAEVDDNIEGVVETIADFEKAPLAASPRGRGRS